VIAHLEKKLADVEERLEKKTKKLQNSGFLAKAAPHIVEGERLDVARLDEEQTVLVAQIDQFRAVR
jgi:valyl-tRNA synthetase